MSGLLGALGGLFGSAAQFGTNYGAALLDAKIQRSLRRTVYQDQMHSMRQAGLNPILAAGATPGMGTSGTMSAPDISGSVDTALRGSKTAEERELLKANRDAAVANAREAQAKADTAEYLREVQRDELMAKAGLHSAGDYRLRLAGDLDRIKAGTEVRLWPKIAAEIGLTDAREVGQRALNVPALREAGYLESEIGSALRGLSLGAKDIWSAAGPLMGGRLQRIPPNPSRRETATSARTPSTSTPRARKVPPLESRRNPAGVTYEKRKDGLWDRVDLHTGEVLESGLKRPGQYD